MKTHLCSCNNCGTILIDTNPASTSIAIEIKNQILFSIQSLEPFEEDGKEQPNGCPICKTDSYLNDNWLPQGISNLIEEPIKASYVDYQYNGCMEVITTNPDESYIYACEQDEIPQFYSVYGHILGEGVECVADCQTQQQAEELTALLQGILEEAKIPKKAFIAVWGDWQSLSFTPTSYNPTAQELNEKQLDAERMYSPENLRQIKALRPQQAWISSEGNHFILRVR